MSSLVWFAHVGMTALTWFNEAQSFTAFNVVGDLCVSPVGQPIGRHPKKHAVKKVNRRSKGTKSEPSCRVCSQTGHYASKCPQLATKLLQAVKKTAGAEQIVSFLQTRGTARTAKIQGLQNRPKRTLKRAKGKRKPNRGAPWSKKRAAASNKSERKARARTRRQSIKSKRRPRAMKVPWNKAEITAKASKAAYRRLVADRWAWKPPRCQCGSKFHEVPWRTCLSRGYGRLFVRCYSCGRILPSISTVTATFLTLVSCNYGHTWNKINNLNNIAEDPDNFSRLVWRAQFLPAANFAASHSFGASRFDVLVCQLYVAKHQQHGQGPWGFRSHGRLRPETCEEIACRWVWVCNGKAKEQKAPGHFRMRRNFDTLI